MKRLTALLTGLFVILAVSSFAQGEFKFEKERHDFGNVTEGDLASYEFEFKNTGDQPIVISNVRASCGCTTPSWTKEPVPPGGKGTIKAVYNSRNRPGPFNKSITITSNATQPTKILYLKGNVLREEPKPAFTEEELKNSPTFTINKPSHNFGKIEIGQTMSYKFKIKNEGVDPLKVEKVVAGCRCVSYTVSEETLPAGKSATLELKYAPRVKGNSNDKVSIFTNDRKTPQHTVILNAEVVESLGSNSMMDDGGSSPFK